MSYSRRYKADLLGRIVGSGHPVAALRMAWRAVRGRLLHEWRKVYALGRSDLESIPDLHASGCQFECLATVREIERLTEELRAYPGLLPDDPRRLCAQRAKFWIGRVDGRLAVLGATRPGDAIGHYFFPLLRGCTLLSHFGTVPEFRGQGLYPALLVHILRSPLLAETEYFVIDTSDWNIGSQRGIERAGFRFIGHGKETRRGGLAWVPLLLPVANGTNTPRPAQMSAAAREPVHV